MTTISRSFVRAVLYGCSHRPKFTAMYHPKKGDEILCHPCNRSRRVVGIETGWKFATVKCRNCGWKYQSEKAGKKRLFELAHKHADARGHHVLIENDGHVSRVAPVKGTQIPLIDDLLLPD